MARNGEATSKYNQSDEESNMEVRRGPWTVDEDFALINYVARHGEGRWNSLARCAGLKRTGKSCRLRWLNYLRPDLRRGNITLDEQLLILQLHSLWGNRWSKIAQHLPGRTDNEIKNYWRTRVQKQAKLLKCDSNKDTLHCLWMPRLVQRIQAAAGPPPPPAPQLPSSSAVDISGGWAHTHSTVDAVSSDSFETPVSDLTDGYNNCGDNGDYYYYYYQRPYGVGQLSLMGPMGFYNQGVDFADNIGPGINSPWNGDDVWFLQQLNGY